MLRKNPGDNPAGSNPEKSDKIYHIPYFDEPDYTRPPVEIPPDVREDLFVRLRFLYGDAKAKQWLPELERILKVHCAHKPQEMLEAEKDFDPKERFTERDMILITYGDLVQGEEHSPLATLYKFVDTHNLGAISTLHILPFFPYSSDRGFAVVDFQRVDPKLGTWEDIRTMGWRYQLMFDGVLNHCSSGSRMFREFCNGSPYYKEFFIYYKSPEDLTPEQRSKILRPRTSDILTRFDTIEGPQWVWTTFSDDQVDLNFRNPAVLMRIVEGLLFYVRQGADVIRLDAVTYIWAEPGTESVNLPETHEIVKILRNVMDFVAPSVALITETNVPHKDNISYFGNGHDEAHMVYNFALPPLVLYTFYKEDATTLSQWAQGMENPSNAATFFNILDTHDGIGLMGVKGILSKEDIHVIIEKAKDHGAYISYKMTEDRTEEPYEVNITWWSAINYDDSDEDMGLQVKRYIASRSISEVLQGVPGVYAHGAIGTSSDHELVKRTNHKRDVNRGVIDSKSAAEGLKNVNSKISRLRREGSKLNLVRTRERAFHPHGDQKVLLFSPSVFAVLRTSPEGEQHILTMTNVTRSPAQIEVSLSDLNVQETRWYDLLTEKDWIAEKDKISVSLGPYEVIWLKPSSELDK